MNVVGRIRSANGRRSFLPTRLGGEIPCEMGITTFAGDVCVREEGREALIGDGEREVIESGNSGSFSSVTCEEGVWEVAAKQLSTCFSIWLFFTYI